MSRNQIIIIILFLSLIHQATAQEKLTLDLKAAKEYALNFNRTIKNSDLSVVQSQEQLKEAITAGLPQVNATTDYSNAMGAEISIQFDENSPASKIPIKPTSNFNLQVGQLIFSGSYIVGIQTAKLYEKLSEKNKTKTEIDVVSQVVENYYLALVSKQALEILEANLENLETVYKKTEPMVTVGMMEKVELDQLSVQVNSLKNALKSAERQLEMTKNMLRLQLGVTPETDLELTSDLETIMENEQLELASKQLFDVTQNVDFQLMDFQKQMSEKQIQLQKAAYLPTISGYYSYTYKLLKPAFDMSPPHMVGLQMDIPIFSSGQRRSKVHQAKIDLETTLNNQALLQDQLTVQFNQLKFNLISAIENFENQKENVKVSREVYESLKRKYDEGMISSLELTTANNNYLNAESDHLTSMLEVLRAQNNLQTLTGEVNK